MKIITCLQIKLAFKREADVQSQAQDQTRSQESTGSRKSSRLLNDELPDEEGESDDDNEIPEIVTAYVNTMAGGLGVNEKQIGISGLRSELLRYESMLLEGLKRKGSGFNREGKRQWEHAVKSAETLSDLRACLMTLEEVVHDTQEEEDEIDSKDTKNKKEVMLSDGWIFDPLSAVVNDSSAESSSVAGDLPEKAEASKVLEETKLQYQELRENLQSAQSEHETYAAELESGGGGAVSKSKQSVLVKKAMQVDEANKALKEVGCE